MSCEGLVCAEWPAASCLVVAHRREWPCRPLAPLTPGGPRNALAVARKAAAKHARSLVERCLYMHASRSGSSSGCIQPRYGSAAATMADAGPGHRPAAILQASIQVRVYLVMRVPEPVSAAHCGRRSWRGSGEPARHVAADERTRLAAPVRVGHGMAGRITAACERLQPRALT